MTEPPAAPSSPACSSRCPAPCSAAPGWTPSPTSCRPPLDGAAETRDSNFITARTAARCLRNPAVTAWVTPPPAGTALARFNPAGVPGSRQTVYLPPKDGGGSAARLVAALPTGSCVAGCPPRRPPAATWTRRCWSSSTRPRTSAGSPTCALWRAATVKLIGPGMDDADFAEDPVYTGPRAAEVAAAAAAAQGQITAASSSSRSWVWVAM